MSDSQLAIEGGQKSVSQSLPPMFPGGMRLGEEEKNELLNVLSRKKLCRYGGPPDSVPDSESCCSKLEAAFAKTIGTKHALAVNSGTAALMSALAAVGLEPGDEVIIPAYTWSATPLSVMAMNGIPILCEVTDSLLMDPDDLLRKITEHTKVILLVHMRGAPCDMDRIMEISEKHGLKVIEDTAQANGAKFKGRMLGSIGDVGCFSTQFNKIITSGEGGFVTMNKTEYYHRALQYHDVVGGSRNNLDRKTYLPGINLRMSELQAAILTAQLPKQAKIVQDCRANYQTLCEMIKPVLSRHEGKVKIRKSNDPEGDAFICMVLMFPSAANAKRATLGLKAEGVEGVPATPDHLFDPETVDYHVYYHWETVIEKRSWSKQNLPWCFAKRKIEYSQDMCPKTLGFLSRSVHIDVSPDLTKDRICEIANAIQKVIPWALREQSA